MQGNNALLVRQIHNRAADLQAACGTLPALAGASSHYARGDDCAAFASALATAAQQAPHCERDLFVARAILQVVLASRLHLHSCIILLSCAATHETKVRKHSALALKAVRTDATLMGSACDRFPKLYWRGVLAWDP